MASAGRWSAVQVNWQTSKCSRTCCLFFELLDSRFATFVPPTSSCSPRPQRGQHVAAVSKCQGLSNATKVEAHTYQELQRQRHCLVWCQAYTQATEPSGNFLQGSLKRKPTGCSTSPPRPGHHERVPHLVPHNASCVCQNIGDDVFNQKCQQVCGRTFTARTIHPLCQSP